MFRYCHGKVSRLSLLLITALSPLAYSADMLGVASPGDSDLIRGRQDRLLEEQRKRLEELQELPGKKAPDAPLVTPADGRCFDIKTITLQGAEHLSLTTQNKVVAPFVNKCLGATQLNELLKAVTDYYLGVGYVTTRAYLPQQDLSSGQLTVLVIEGKLEGVHADAQSGLTPREIQMAFPGREGEILNLREFEQMVDQLNRLPSNNAQIELAPGQAVGGSDVQVKNTQTKPWHASLSRDNDGQKSTGEQQWGVGLDWDSPLGLADQLSLRGGHDAISDSNVGIHSDSLNYNVPYGWWNFSYAFSQSQYRSQVQGNGFTFPQTGDSTNHQLRAERLLFRDAVSKTSVNFALGHLVTNSYIQGSKVDISSNRISEFDLGFNHGRRIGSAFVNLDLGWQHGIGMLGAQGDTSDTPGSPTARFDKYTATASYLQAFKLFGEDFSFSSLGTVQHSPDVLYSAQRMSLGGLSSVRGYKDQSLSGDNGAYWRNDVRWTRPVTWSAFKPWLSQFGVGLGYDQGVIEHGQYNPEVHGRMSSDSVELFARGQHFAASVTFAHSLERPAVLSDREQPIYFRLDFFL